MRHFAETMKFNRPKLKHALLRFLRLRCPACGRGNIIQRPFRIATDCRSCGVIFNREQGFFVGAILINVVVTELIILSVYVVTILLLGLSAQYALPLLFLVAVTFPVAFYHHSWSLWLAFDHFVESLPSK